MRIVSYDVLCCQRSSLYSSASRRVILRSLLLSIIRLRESGMAYASPISASLVASVRLLDSLAHIRALTRVPLAMSMTPVMTPTADWQGRQKIPPPFEKRAVGGGI